MEHIYDYTIKLIRYVLNGDVPELPESIDFEQLYAFGRSHGVENMLYVGLRDLKIDVPAETIEKFKTAYEMQIMVEATQAVEFQAIAEEFEKQSIDFVTFKGIQLRYMYPMPDYRKSGDIDILVRGDDEEKTDFILKQFGYQVMEQFENYEVHAGYLKAPFVEVEIHRQLVKESNRSYRFCCKAWENIHLKKEYKHHYEFDNEFAYTYLLAHLCNHLVMGGAGIRILTDFFIVRQKMQFDEKKLQKFIKKANLTELDSMVNRLILKWFGNSYERDESIEKLEEIVFNGGSFGTFEQLVLISRADTKKGMLIRILQKIFMRKKYLQTKHKHLRNAPYIVLWVYNIYFYIRYRRTQIGENVEAIISNDNNSLSELSSAIRNR